MLTKKKHSVRMRLGPQLGGSAPAFAREGRLQRRKRASRQITSASSMLTEGVSACA